MAPRPAALIRRQTKRRSASEARQGPAAAPTVQSRRRATTRAMSATTATFTTAWAPAKVNLYLHVGPPGPGGLHPVDSLVMFADMRAADRISARVAPQLSLNVEG